MILAAAALAMLAEPGRAPAAYVDCANAFAADLANIDQTERPVFTCGRDLFESAPGSGGTTADMNEAYVAAIDAGATYREMVLEPELIAAMQAASEDQAFDARKRLAEVLAKADEADDILCRLQYDLFGGGTMRTLVAGSCHLARDDQLIGALLTLKQSLTN